MRKKNAGMFKEGESGNPSGRPAGSENKLNSELRDVIKKFIESKVDELPSWFDELSSPKEKITAFEKLLQYILPRQKEVGLEVDSDALRKTFVEKFWGSEEKG